MMRMVLAEMVVLLVTMIWRMWMRRRNLSVERDILCKEQL